MAMKENALMDASDGANDSAAIRTPETAYTGHDASDYDALRFRDRAGQAIHRRELEKVLAILEGKEGLEPVLEVGCGTGRLLAEVHRRGYRIDGCDGSADMLAEVRKKGLGDLHLFQSPANAIDAPDATYGFAYSVRVLNQLPSPAYALETVAELLRVTRPGGLVLIDFINEKRPRAGISARRETTRLSVDGLMESAARSGGKTIAIASNFVLGMQAYKRVPGALVPAVDGLDRALSTLMPKGGSRVYVTLRKVG
jgi:SAM-dependent methyltransferase